MSTLEPNGVSLASKPTHPERNSPPNESIATRFFSWTRRNDEPVRHYADHTVLAYLALVPPDALVQFVQTDLALSITWYERDRSEPRGRITVLGVSAGLIASLLRWQADLTGAGSKLI